MKASGISIYFICGPVLISAFLISFLLLILNESIIPYATQKSEYIENVCIKNKKPTGFFKQNQIWYKSQNAIYSIQMFDSKKNTLEGITINRFDKNFNLIQRIDAKKAQWEGQGWLFYGVSIRNRQKDGSFKAESFPKKKISLPENPQDFKIVERSPEEMTFSELKDYIKKIKSEGYDVTRYQVDLHLKISFPFISLIMAILGIPFALKAERGGGVALGVGISVFIGAGYYFVYVFNQSLGHSGVLPPIISAWLTNILFGTVGVFFLIGSPR
jgi:lipopolysaccharide export system permease protein